MRIISQNGLIDVPYEMAAIRVIDDAILISMVGGTGKGSVIARYSTPAKAEKAMEMLRNAYDNLHFLDITGFSNELKTAVSLLSQKQFDEITSPYFRFPDDGDVEE